MAIDDPFAGFDHESLPDVDLDFSCKSDSQSTQPEAVVDVVDDGLWVRLPITEVETRVSKDGPASLSFTSQVHCPVTWGQAGPGDEFSDLNKVPIYEYVSTARKEDATTSGFPQFGNGRVYYWNKYTEQYQIQQFGYIGAIGPSTQDGVFRFNIYDASDLMTGISVTKTYDSPDAQQVARFVSSQMGDRTPIPMRGFSTTAPFEQIEIEGDLESFDKSVHGWLDENVPILKFGLSDTFEGFDEWFDNTLHTGGHKHFRRNKHNLADVMEWLTNEIGGSWYFEPDDYGVSLIVNNGGSGDTFQIARNAYYDGNFDHDGLQYIQGYNPVAIDVINNTSLEDLKPINFLELNGETADSFLGTQIFSEEIVGPIGAPKAHTDKYPHVEVTYPPLLDRTGGRELGPEPIESGVTTLSEAKQQAVEEFKDAHADATDGSIGVRALPSIRPYDYIAAVPVCNDIFDADMSPIQYEVHSIRHHVTADEPYMTNLGVGLALDDDALEVDASYLEVDPE